MLWGAVAILLGLVAGDSVCGASPAGHPPTPSSPSAATFAWTVRSSLGPWHALLRRAISRRARRPHHGRGQRRLAHRELAHLEHDSAGRRGGRQHFRARHDQLAFDGGAARRGERARRPHRLVGFARAGAASELRRPCRARERRSHRYREQHRFGARIRRHAARAAAPQPEDPGRDGGAAAEPALARAAAPVPRPRGILRHRGCAGVVGGALAPRADNDRRCGAHHHLGIHGAARVARLRHGDGRHGAAVREAARGGAGARAAARDAGWPRCTAAGRDRRGDRFSQL